jgi:hypothetical protein
MRAEFIGGGVGRRWLESRNLRCNAANSCTIVTCEILQASPPFQILIERCSYEDSQVRSNRKVKGDGAVGALSLLP